MSRRELDAVTGWLVIDKSVGPTSSRVVAMAKRLLRARKAGHGGTLDPLATGVLPIAFGEATKTVAYVMGGPKQYRFTIGWGAARTTDDAAGEVTAYSDARPTEEMIRAVLGEFVGAVEQMPPAYSALKIGGQRAYALARRGQAPDLEARTVRIDRLTLLDQPQRDSARFEVDCGKGTYVRALARDLAMRLGTFGHVTALRRTRSGPFTEEHAISVENLADLGHSLARVRHLLPLESALDDIPALSIDGADADRLRCGQTIRVRNTEDGAVFVVTAGQPVALAHVDNGIARPERVFNLCNEDDDVDHG